MAAGEGSVVMAGRLAIGITARALLAALALVVAAAVAALAQPAPHGLRERDLIARGTPVLTVDGLTVFHSPGSEPEARAYGRTVADAARWFRAHTAWDGPLVMAVLDADDWAQLVMLPYPVPHAEIIGSMVVMPKDISGFPGFGDWSLDARRLNLALTVHELGHIIMRGQGVLPGNHWIDELMANVVMAAYVRAHPGDLDFILAGPPEGFANPGPFSQLVDLDNFYAGGGLENYAWFQFRLARLAGHLAAAKPVRDLVAALAAAFPEPPPGIRDTIATTLAKLDAIAPGSSALVADMAGDSAAPRVTTGSCEAMKQPQSSGAGAGTVLFVENRGAGDVRHRIPEKVAEDAAYRVRLEHHGEGLGEEELQRRIDAAVATALASTASYSRLAGGRVERVAYRAGALMEVGGRCLSLPGEPSTLILGE